MGMDAKTLCGERMRGTSVTQRNSFAKGNITEWIGLRALITIIAANKQTPPKK